ncbi:MAG TPA: TonB-dependent receptor, partial [Thermoanaerobaculia bacterium]
VSEGSGWWCGAIAPPPGFLAPLGMTSVRPPIALLLLLIVAASASAQVQTSDTITVTATRTETRLADTPSSVVVLSQKTLDETAAPTLDDALRQVPGFALFRRTGSRVANPTSQGVSLRGIGASGASRALVMDDGIPLNDPFGGWVYWGRVPRASLDRVEILRGGASDLYGSSAMGGVVQFIRRHPSSPSLAVEASGGSQSTGNASMFAGASHESWGASVALDLLRTSGYVLVDPEQRGIVDRAADARHSAADATLEHDHAFLRGSFFRESRNNGTPLQTNDTTIRQLAAGANAGAFVARAWGSDQDYAQTFSAISGDRSSERLTVDQRVPSRSAGASAQWSHALGASNAIVAGADARQVSGASNELQFSGTRTTPVDASGRQRTAAGFLEDVVAWRDLSVTAGVRYDAWRNFDAQRNGAPLAGRSDSALSPRLAVLYRPSSLVAFTASAYRAFRAPTLNELYRGFRVGNVVTVANESLAPERLNAFELGARMRNVRATLFWMGMNDVISNVTLSSTPTLITRQRQNVSTSRSRGVELEGDWLLWRSLRLSPGYLFSDSVVTSGDLEGKRLPQVPRHQASAELVWGGRSTIALQTRWSSRQFDDDLNQFPLRGYFVADMLYAHPIGTGLDFTLAAENIFNRRIEAGATPVFTLGQPRSIRAGVRFRGTRSSTPRS